MRAEGVEKMNGQRRWREIELRSTEVKGRVGNVAGADRTLEKDWWKQKAARQEGKSRSWLIRERGNVQKQFSAADGEQRLKLSDNDTLTSA